MSFLCNWVLFEIFTAFAGIILSIFILLKRKLNYWQNLNVPVLKPTLPFGDTKNIFLGRTSFGEQLQSFYQQFRARNEKYGGIYMGTSALLLAVDPELVKHIMEIDFQHFNTHGGYVNEKHDPLSIHLFNLEDTKWRDLRVKLTPTFTSGKMKMMFHTVIHCGNNLKKNLDQEISAGNLIDIRDILGRFGTDVIGSVAFGLDINSLQNPDDEFRYYGKKAAEFDIWDNVKIFMQVLLPHQLLYAIGHKFTKSDVEKFFMRAVRDTVEFREKNNIYRKDFMHLLLQLKNRGFVKDDGKIMNNDGQIQEKALTMTELAAQAYVFFMAGYETSSITVSLGLFELAEYVQIQNKLRKEINEVLGRHNNKLTYEALQEMTYMDQVLFETLRKHPPLALLTRECSKDYTIPGSSIVIKKGMGVIISVLGLHKDPEYYPDPEKFDPERFNKENKKLRPGFTWLPFGDGPRICIGSRFGILQSKIALFIIVSNYKVTLNSKTRVPLRQEPRAFTTRYEGDIWLNFEKI